MPRRAALASALGLLTACAHATPPATGPDAAWLYEATYVDGGLTIVATFPRGTLVDDLLVFDEGHGVDVLSATDLEGDALSPRGEGARWTVPGCAERGCRVRYAHGMERSDDSAGHRFTIADAFEGRAPEVMLTSPPPRWLIHALRVPRGVRYRLQVTVPEGVRFITGINSAPDGAAGTYEARAVELSGAPYSAFGVLTVEAIEVPGGRVMLGYPTQVFAGEEAPMRAWVTRAVTGVAQYFGEFPVPHAAIIVVPSGAHGVYFGAARGNGGASVQVLLGPSTDESTYQQDWVLVHEVIHLGLPNLPRAQRWLEEGAATYLETVIRTRLGVRTEKQLWSELSRNLPRGLLSPEDGGYNRSRSWAHMYWGGALFCFLADVEIRTRTRGEKSLADALRAVQRAGGTITTSWAPQALIETADGATGVPVLAELWSALAEGKAPEVELSRVLADLGVRRHADGGIWLDEAAPRAWVRRAITGSNERPR